MFEDRIAKGCKWLDEQYGTDWCEVARLRIAQHNGLDITDPRRCVVGCLFGSFDNFFPSHPKDIEARPTAHKMSVELGFMLPMDSSDDDWDKLEDEWLVELGMENYIE